MHLLCVCHQIKQQKIFVSWNVQLIAGDNMRDSNPCWTKCDETLWLGNGERLEWNCELFPPSLLEVNHKDCGGQLWQSGALRKSTLEWCRARAEQGTGTQLVILDAVEKGKGATLFPSHLKVEKYGQPTLFSHFEITTYLQIVSKCLLKTNMRQIWSQCGTQITSSFTRGFMLWSGKTLLN